MKRPWIQCPQCMGHGEIPLPDSLLDTLCILKMHPEGLYIPKIHALSVDRKFVKVTAVNNRLTSLEQHGMVTREKEGKNFRWKAKLRWSGKGVK